MRDPAPTVGWRSINFDKRVVPSVLHRISSYTGKPYIEPNPISNISQQQGEDDSLTQVDRQSLRKRRREELNCEQSLCVRAALVAESLLSETELWLVQQDDHEKEEDSHNKR